MLFLEDLYASKRPSGPEKRSSNGRQPRAPRREPPLPPPNLPSESHHASEALSVPVERRERASSTKRNSIFSRRRSTATNSSSDSQKRNSTLSAGATSRRSSLADMAVVDGDALKSKLLFGFHSGKKTGRTRSDSTPSDDVGVKERNGVRRGHQRGASADSKDQSSAISAPYGFQHIARIERSFRTPNENTVSYETRYSPPNHIAQMTSPPPPQELQSSLAKRSQKRPPPLRPRRPDESQIPHEILSPAHGLPSLRQIRSAEAFNVPPSVPQQQPSSPSFSPPMMTAPLPPRRSSRRAPYHNEEPKPSFPTQYPTANDLGLSSEWDRLLPLYNSRPGNHREAQVMPYNQTVNLPENSSIPKPHPSPLFSPPLEQVPEEPEGLNTPRDSNEFNRKTSLRHAKSSPNMSRSSPSSRTFQQSSIPKVPELPKKREDRPVSQGSDTLGDLSRRSFIIKEGAGKGSRNGNRDTVASWEEDIDFCYDHAAEANCEFDWNNVSKFLDTESSDDELEFGSAYTTGYPALKKLQSGSTDSSEGAENYHNKSFFHQSIIPGPEGIPDLDSHSIFTGSSNSLALATPHAISSADAFKPRKSEEILVFTSPQLPPLDLRGDMDSDQLYEQVMVGYSIKEAQQQFLPILEPKAYSPTAPQKSLNFATQIAQNASPALKQRRFSNTHSKVPVHPPPTSAPVPPVPPVPQPLRYSMLKDLPPLPPESPRPVAPATIRVENLMAQIRGPRESPVDSKSPSITPPSSTKQSPIPDQPPVNPMMRRRPTRTTENPMKKIQEIGPETLSRNGSEDTVVTTIFVPATPPDSPDQNGPLAPLLAPTHTPRAVTSRIPLALAQRPLKHSPSLPAMLQREATGNVPSNALNSPPGSPRSPFRKSPTSPRLNYSLFPPQAKPGRPRRLTTT